MNIGHINGISNDALLYLAGAYALFFIVLFVYLMTLSRRQTRVQEDLALLRLSVDEHSASSESLS